MPKKYKVTGFARFFIVMLFIAPVAFLIASYYNGEDGFQNLKNMLNIGDKPETVESQEPRAEHQEEVATIESDQMEARAVDSATTQNAALSPDMKKLQEELQFKDQRLEELYKTNDELRQQVREKEQEIERLKEQLKGQDTTQ